MTVVTLHPRELTPRQIEQRLLDKIDGLLGLTRAEARLKAAVVEICRKKAS